MVGLLGVLTAAAVLVADLHRFSGPTESGVIGGPYASLLESSVDLGPARTDHVQLTAALRDDSRPDLLMGWALQQNLSVRWRPGDSWAILEGAPEAVSGAFDVDVHDYRGMRGQVFYASPQQPSVPRSLSVEVAALGRILGYTPHRESKVWMFPQEVPDQGLNPSALLRTYNAMPLHDSGYTGKGITVVVFAFDGFLQSDLDTFSTTFNLPKFTPEVVGGMPPARRGEATMDLEAIHAVAPDAKKVLVNARPTVEGDGGYEKIAKMMEDTEARFPGAVWSFSIGWGCDKLITAADLVPVRSALADAQKSGTTAFDASGDLAGLDCKGGQEWSSPPSENDVGLDAVASMPEMTDVGGTTLSTDPKGVWLAEQSWFDPPLSQGTGGGVSALYERPSWQRHLDIDGAEGKRLTPDIAAVADPFTGVQIVFDNQIIMGGGTSLSAPIWAGLTAVMNQYMLDRGGRLIGDINPLLYAIASGAPLPSFQDVDLGGNAVADARSGYDLVTGLGTPNIENLAQNLLVAQRVVS
ncbi:S53 family peptidase [Mycobacterium sp. CVI_P3]|uniref:S53 family peptidase n=1 Tax=Mycobacterium pinniadriaticum TaxID=2994102 RepID=A0ABT3SK94_9MYCO|nr:S53 family peptidase [Mycobacterium pinniadriaticum]MCX2933483.1 S53 family peptidase [Mycobacterium pinniadriaticum]MCX2939878.1 S53 family peptidase [Mycobacterium pinniadriaticum]